MSRIINLNSPSKIRNRNRRTMAEILRHMSTKPEVDDETKDMTALIVYLLREIHAGIITAVEAWEKRGYWLKADRFMREWQWTLEMASNLEDVLRNESWDLLPGLLADLFPHTAEIKLKRFTRSASTWQGAYIRLMEEQPGELPW